MDELEISYLFKSVPRFTVCPRLKKAGLNRSRVNRDTE